MANAYTYTYDTQIVSRAPVDKIPGYIVSIKGSFTKDFSTGIDGLYDINMNVNGFNFRYGTYGAEGNRGGQIYHLITLYGNPGDFYVYEAPKIRLVFRDPGEISSTDLLYTGPITDFRTSPPYTEYGSIQGGGRPVAVTATTVCFCTGSLIRTARGEVAVEDLRIGDHAVTASGALRSAIWIGHRDLDGRGRALPTSQQPVHIRGGAFGTGVPTRDLRLSPGHPVLVGANESGAGGHLVPIMCLINGTTVARDPVSSVTYWHVELDAHDILLAEGLAAESYYDMGSRRWFEGENGPLVDPDFVPAGEHGRCRPVAVDGPVVEAERARLSVVFSTALSAECAWDEAERFAWVAR